jgi:hypothetical protein
MRKFHSIAALCGDGLRPELQALFDRLAIDARSELFVRDDGMLQAGPDPTSETAPALLGGLRATDCVASRASAILKTGRDKTTRRANQQKAVNPFVRK